MMRKSEFVVYVNPFDDKHYQEVYASQIYGTFFAVFAKFNDAKKSGDMCLLSQIDLKVVNYKGVLDIGIVKVKNLDDIESEPSVKRLELEMRAMNPEAKQNIPEYEMNFEIQASFKKGDVIRFERSLRELHDAKDVALEHGLFDSEFYYREGLKEPHKYSKRKPKPREPQDKVSQTVSKIEGGLEGLIVGSGIMCPDSDIWLWW